MKDNNAELEKLLTDWQVFYKKFFGPNVDLSSLVVPSRQLGFDRLLVIAPGVTIQRAFNVCQGLFPCGIYMGGSFDEVVSKNDRTIDQGAYAIWVRDGQEADEELAGKTADDLSVAKTSTITVLERFIYELKFFQETRDHLNRETITLCAGSRNCDGLVFLAYWRSVQSGGDKFDGGWFRPDKAYAIFRSRRVVAS